MYSTKQLLQQTRKIVEAGWTQGRFYENGCYCLVGAAAKACELTVSEGAITTSPTLEVMLQGLRRHMPLGYQRGNVVLECTSFNDLNTKKEVLTVIDLAIKDQP